MTIASLRTRAYDASAASRRTHVGYMYMADIARDEERAWDAYIQAARVASEMRELSLSGPEWMPLEEAA